jgi:DNA-binding phage protein
MTNTALLREKIDNAGIKLSFIAKKLGMSRQYLDKKLKDGSDFKAYQMIILVDILHLSDDEATAIFYAESVG